MADDRGRVSWFVSDPRAVFRPALVRTFGPAAHGARDASALPGTLRVPRSLRTLVGRGTFGITSDVAFAHVIRACAHVPRVRGGHWLHPDIIGLFERFHALGVAHSVEAWLVRPRERAADERDVAEQRACSVERPGLGVLVGGLYGVAIGRVFCGESMFSLPALGGSNASKVCLVHLVEHLRRRGFVLLDAQIMSVHTASLGAVDMPLDAYLDVVRAGLGVTLDWSAAEVSQRPLL